MYADEEDRRARELAGIFALNHVPLSAAGAWPACYWALFELAVVFVGLLGAPRLDSRLGLVVAAFLLVLGTVATLAGSVTVLKRRLFVGSPEWPLASIFHASSLCLQSPSA